MRERISTKLGWLVVAGLAFPLLYGGVGHSQPIAGQPKAPPLTAEQQEQVKEADRLGTWAAQLRREGKLAEAIAAVEKKLAIERKVLGDVHETVGGSLEQLAGLHLEREEFAKARAAWQEMLALRIQLRGRRHYSVADARLALADVDRLARFSAADLDRWREARQGHDQVQQLYGQGKWQEAVPIAETVLKMRRELWGESHPNTAADLAWLGALLEAQKNYDAARLYYEQVLAIFKQVRGDNHPSTATALTYLGQLLSAQRNYAAACPYLEQALAIRRTALGDGHLDTATAFRNLGSLLHAQGEYAAARPHLEQALGIYQKALGDHHPDTATALNDLGVLLKLEGEYAVARPYLEQALVIRKQALGDHHPETAQSLNNLGRLLQAQGDYALARLCYEQALAIYNRVRGGGHPDTTTTLSNLGMLLKVQGDYAAARLYLQRALVIRRQQLGNNHPLTATALSNLGLGRDRCLGTNVIIHLSDKTTEPLLVFPSE